LDLLKDCVPSLFPYEQNSLSPAQVGTAKETIAHLLSNDILWENIDEKLTTGVISNIKLNRGA